MKMNARELFDLTGKVALVIGGSRGLGKEMAMGFGEAGARVAITARREQWLDPACEEMKGQGIDCIAFKCDMSDQAGMRKVVAEIVDKWGKIDVLLNCAAISWGGPPEEMSLEKFQEVVVTDASGLFICCQEAGRQMIKQGGGVIINVASVAGLVATDPQVMQAIGYQVAKGGVLAVTRQLAVEWVKYNIRVNCIVPGFFPTRFAQAILEKAEDKLIPHIPMGRLGRLDEVKGVALFLASDASSYVTGQHICVDGGLTAW